MLRRSRQNRGFCSARCCFIRCNNSIGDLWINRTPVVFSDEREYFYGTVFDPGKYLHNFGNAAAFLYIKNTLAGVRIRALVLLLRLTNTFFSFDAIYFIASVAMFCWDKNVVAVVTLWLFDVCYKSTMFINAAETSTPIGHWLEITQRLVVADSSFVEFQWHCFT